uniref:Phospholipase A2 n=1 Tax=Hoffmannihadrurus gertschi TaxID=380989 RepID=PA2_HOFGE|nr:RecName: Full=Phospholipase A2; Short=HgPLA2; AltName: Full=Group III heterodimeric phospholipase A2; AltName: Full=Phosphatidylcholine 2-acylhydrolase; Contains: RecName: Full=Phospholipase A2 large subunit; Contains: RecName: Full=Phospholipase A2 small subunit; Flags: Precursor [Hadrurus gertschi]
MSLIIVLVISVLSADAVLSMDNELYLNLEPSQRSSWPVARAVRMQFSKRSEGGRESRKMQGCQILESLNDIAREALRTPRHTTKRISKDEMEFFEGRCLSVGESERTVLGTKWCGAGNEAANYSDLGYFNNVDRCCREHDHCDNIPAGETKYGLKNEGTYTMMNCKCEKAFDKCLSDISGYFTRKAVSAVKFTYFTLYGNGCYNVKCENGRSPSNECPNGVAEYTGETGLGAKVINFGK